MVQRAYRAHSLCNTQSMTQKVCDIQTLWYTEPMNTKPMKKTSDDGQGPETIKPLVRCRGNDLPPSPKKIVSPFNYRLLFVGCLTSQQHASVSQGRICSDNFMCCHTEMEVADQTFHLTQSQYTDTGPTSPSTDPITPGAWQGSHWSSNF